MGRKSNHIPVPLPVFVRWLGRLKDLPPERVLMLLEGYTIGDQEVERIEERENR